MSDIFISYKREDALRVARLVKALEGQGLSVWWDRDLPGGESWRDNIQQALDDAKCAVVVWTKTSIGADGGFVRDEASSAARRNILVPVMMDKVDPPLGFGEHQAIDLTRWRGRQRDPFFQDLVSAIRTKIEGRAVPRPKGPMARLRRRLTAGGITAALVALALAFATNTLNLQNTVCSAPFAQPLLSDTCGALGLGARPKKAERIAWGQRPEGDCEALREHLRKFPEGAYRATASALLDGRSVKTIEETTPTQQPLRMVVVRDAHPASNETAAKADAIERGKKKAQAMCRDFAASGQFRFRDADVRPQEWFCDTVRGGTLCGFEGDAVCTLDAIIMKELEICHSSPVR